MSMPRYAARRDDNEAPIIEAATRLGWWLIKLHEPCDWLGWRHGQWHTIEIKSAKGELTAKQQIFHTDAHHRGARILIWREVDDVIRDSNARAVA